VHEYQFRDPDCSCIIDASYRQEIEYPVKAQKQDSNVPNAEIAKILIVDDDERICRSLQAYLEYEGFTVNTVGNGMEMWQQCEKVPPDVVLLDIMLPGIDGITLAAQLRVKMPLTGIIMLTGKDKDLDTVVGLEVGADDYVTKPFDNRVLLARIHSVLRRLVTSRKTDGHVGTSGKIIRFDGWSVNLTNFELHNPEGNIVDLSSAEFKLLEILVTNIGHVMSREVILQRLSNREWQPEDRSVDVLIGKLRKVLETDPAQPKLIRTIRNLGYQFTAGTN